MPFSDDFIDLYEKIKTEFCADFVFNNAGDLDNQQSIIQDIVEGIYSADIIIADLTGLNPNVFYELGLAHAMNKNVIIITQNISELPFDIKSYRANEYSMKFNKMPDLINKLRDLLNRSMTDSTKFGNPVTDYIPNYKVNNIDDNNFNNNESDSVEFDESGIVDYTEDIIENASTMKEELNNIVLDLFHKAQSDHYQFCDQYHNGECDYMDNTCYAEHFNNTVRTVKGQCPNPLVYGYQNIFTKYNLFRDSFMVEQPFNLDDTSKDEIVYRSVIRLHTGYYTDHIIGGAISKTIDYNENII